jgi:hypothetical protein
MTPSLRTGLAALLLLAGAACHPEVIGNGQFVVRSFDEPGFDRVEVGYGFTASVQVGGAVQLVQISGDENIVDDHLSVEVSDGALRITNKDEFTPTHAVMVHVDVPALVAVTARQAAAVTVSGVSAAAFEVEASEAGLVTVSGAPAGAAALTATLQSGGVLDARSFPVASADLTLGALSAARLSCSGPVTGAAAGASSVAVSGGGTCALALSGGATCVESP